MKVLREIMQEILQYRKDNNLYAGKQVLEIEEIILRHMDDAERDTDTEHSKDCGECSRRKWYQMGYKDGTKGQIVECCPHCDKENVLYWDVEKDGYQIFCPNCGEVMMLCSMCDARDGAICDWTENGCKHSDEIYRENNTEITRHSKDKWTPVEKLLPEEGVYLVSCDDEDYPIKLMRLKRETDGTKPFYTSQGIYDGAVYAWMELPDQFHRGRINEFDK